MIAETDKAVILAVLSDQEIDVVQSGMEMDSFFAIGDHHGFRIELYFSAPGFSGKGWWLSATSENLPDNGLWEAVQADLRAHYTGHA